MGLNSQRVSAGNTEKHIDFIECFRLFRTSGNTPSSSHCFISVFPCFSCFSPKGERAARNTRAAALPREARR
jgi:hypothetical protein